MTAKPNDGHRTKRQFDRAYRRLAQTGSVDFVGSIQHALLLSAWRKNNCPADVRAFLQKHKGIIQ